MIYDIDGKVIEPKNPPPLGRGFDLFNYTLIEIINQIYQQLKQSRRLRKLEHSLL